MKPYVLRYWETEFKSVKPQKTRSQQRLYRRRDVELLLKIRHLLYDKRYTIEGARSRLREQGHDEGPVTAPPVVPPAPAINRETLTKDQARPRGSDTYLRGVKTFVAGRGAAWLAHLSGGQGVAGSNPVAPTKTRHEKPSRSWSRMTMASMAPGIRAVAEALRAIGDVVVAAPDRERSAASHSISLDRPLRVDEVEAGVFAIDGTPVDCVYLALLHLVPRRPALVVSGINNGFNLGSDVFYSGTVAGAVEGALRGVPALAVSLERPQPAGLLPRRRRSRARWRPR